MLTLRADAPAASVVDLRAPYLLFNQSRYVGLQGADFFVQLGPEPLKYFHNGNRLNVSANLVDVRGLRDLIGFDDVRFDVQGDLRMGSPLCRPQHPHQAGGARPHDAERRADLPDHPAAASSPRASTWQRGRRETFTATTPRRS